MKPTGLIGIVLAILIQGPSASAQCNGTWTQRMPTVAPSARNGHAMVFDSDRKVCVLFGGTTAVGISSTNSNETWEWNGSTWTLRTPTTSPSARTSFNMAYDSNRHRTVLFSGFVGNSVSGETWEWNGANWMLQSTTGPTGRSYFAMAYDSQRHVTILFGGVNGVEFSDLWEWDGATWTNRLPLNFPTRRHGPSMVYDELHGVSVLFGGGLLNFVTLKDDLFNDTWQWNGTTWLQESPTTSPTAREYFATAYDTRGQVTLFGGIGSSQTNETWQWDGANWTMRTPSSPPSARNGATMAFDSARGVAVMFGGEAGASLLGDTWEWNAPQPFISQQPVDHSIVAGDTASFSVAATGPGGTPTFKWRKGGSLLTDGGHVSGSSTATLRVSSADGTDAGKYDCQVSTTCGNSTSKVAVLAVDLCHPASAGDDCDDNGVLDSCDIAANPALDANNNGIIDSCETASDATSAAGGAHPAGLAVPCGACGGGAAAMMPLALGILGVARCARMRRRAI